MLEALKITEETYDIYTQMPLRENEDYLALTDAKNHYVVKNNSDTNDMDWTCISEITFDKKYEFYKYRGKDPRKFRMIKDK